MTRKTPTFLIGAAFAAVLGAAPGMASAADGINRLIAVTQMKADNANDEALLGADRQRDLVKKQQQLRQRKGTLASQDRIDNFEIQKLMGQHSQIQKTRSDVQQKHDETANAVIRNYK